jgi:hypothetical protein
MHSDRRTSERLSITEDVHYRVLKGRNGEASAFGKTVNISGSGVLFTSDHPLSPGDRIELSINWPAKLNDKCALKLVARGRVVRCQDGLAAIEIMQHEFRVRKPGASLEPQMATPVAS